jgi:hypothetical protein
LVPRAALLAAVSPSFAVVRAALLVGATAAACCSALVCAGCVSVVSPGWLAHRRRLFELVLFVLCWWLLFLSASW